MRHPGAGSACGWPRGVGGYEKKGGPRVRTGTSPVSLGPPHQGRRRPTLPPLRAVPSAMAGLTSLFGMGRGGTPPPLPPLFVTGERFTVAPAYGQERDTSRRRNETYGPLVRVGFAVAGFAPPAYRRGSLPRPLNGDLISEGASRLDAFSAYHFRTWLPGGAAGATTGTPEVRPSRSSRTKDGAPQISHARNR